MARVKTIGPNSFVFSFAFEIGTFAMVEVSGGQVVIKLPGSRYDYTRKEMEELERKAEQIASLVANKVCHTPKVMCSMLHLN